MSAVEFSTADLAGLSEIRFANGLPGFPDAHHFDRERWGADDSPFSVLSGRDQDGINFIVVDPVVFFPEYRPSIDDDVLGRIGVRDVSSAVMLVILTLGRRPEEATANLLGPLLVNPATGDAVQAVLTGTDYRAQVALANASPDGR